MGSPIPGAGAATHRGQQGKQRGQAQQQGRHGEPGGAGSQQHAAAPRPVTAAGSADGSRLPEDSSALPRAPLPGALPARGPAGLPLPSLQSGRTQRWQREKSQPGAFALPAPFPLFLVCPTPPRSPHGRDGSHPPGRTGAPSPLLGLPPPVPCAPKLRLSTHPSPRQLCRTIAGCPAAHQAAVCRHPCPSTCKAKGQAASARSQDTPNPSGKSPTTCCLGPANP